MFLTPLVAQGRALVDQFYEAAEEVGRICLALAPAYLSDDQAAGRLAPYAEEVGLALDDVLARRATPSSATGAA